MDLDLAWVNGKSARQSWRYADAFQRSIISEAIYHLVQCQFILSVVELHRRQSLMIHTRLHFMEIGLDWSYRLLAVMFQFFPCISIFCDLM